jgi:hypothetical protein
MFYLTNKATRTSVQNILGPARGALTGGTRTPGGNDSDLLVLEPARSSGRYLNRPGHRHLFLTDSDSGPQQRPAAGGPAYGTPLAPWRAAPLGHQAARCRARPACLKQPPPPAANAAGPGGCGGSRPVPPP